MSGSGMAVAADQAIAPAALQQVQLKDRLTGNFTQSIKHYQQGDYEEALALLLKVEKAEPENAQVHYYLGMTYQGMLKYPEAEASFAKSVELDPSQGNAYSHLGEILYRLNKYEEALGILNEAEAKGGRPAYIAYLKGLTLMELADYAGAIAALQRAQVLNSAYRQKATYALGMIYSKQQDKPAAEKAFMEAIAIDSESPAGVFASIGLQSLHRVRVEKRPLHLDFGYGLHYDDNVLLKPGGVSTGIFPAGEKDFTHVLSLHASYEPELSGSFGIQADATYYKSIHHKISRLDVDGIGISLTPGLTTGMGSFTLEGRADYYLVGRSHYLNILSLHPSFSFSMGSTHQGVLHAGYQNKNFFEPVPSIAEDRDADNWSAGYTHYINSEDQRSYLALDYTIDRDSARGRNWDYIGSRFSISGQYSFGKNFGFRFNGDYYHQNYSHVHTVFGIARQDRTYSVAPILTYSLDWGATILLQYSHVLAQSNIRVYDYSRSITGVGFEYSY